MFTKKYYYLFFTFIILQITVFSAISSNNDEKIQTLLDEESQKIQTQYKSIFKNFENLANTIFNGYINNIEVSQLLADNKRDELYEKLKEPYRYLKTVNIHQLHFHTKESHSFLRMHKPSKYGDDLSSFRHSINFVNTRHHFISGLEMGRLVPGFRFVYPMFYNNKHIGSVETSFKVKSFSQKLTELYNVRTTFLLNKDIANQKLFKSSKNNYEQSIESTEYVTYKDSTSQKIKRNIKILKKVYDQGLREEIKSKISAEKLFSIAKRINGFYKIVTFLPVSDIQERHIGYFVVYRDSHQLKELNKEYATLQTFTVFIILALFILAFRELKHKDSLKEEVKIKTQKLNDTAVKLEEQTYELEELNLSLEKRIALEIEKNAKQERELFQQSKQAALGDMISNIAHQWRQPLSAIATSASGMQLTQYSNTLTGDDIINYTDAIIRNANYLSQTIDDFRDFIKSDKKITRFDVNHAIEKSLDIVNSSINNHNLHIVTDFEDELFASNYENELQQAFINVFTNAKDAIKEKVTKSDDKIIFIKTYKKGNNVNISVRDTAGGIDEEIMDKIFEPYFTTKHQAQGTGLGLYMTHRIVIESMKGSILVENINFNYNDKIYDGAEFTIELPLNS